VAVSASCSSALNAATPLLPPQAVKPAPPNMAAAETAPVLLKNCRRDVLGVMKVSLDVETPEWTFCSC
jgi:hypothetical protein